MWRRRNSISYTLCLARRKWGSSRPLGCLFRWWEGLVFSVIIHANRRFFEGAGKVFALDFVELMRVEASQWKCGPPLMFTFIICNKKLRFYCDFCHQKVLKKNCQPFLVNKKHGWRFLYNLDEVQDPFLTFFSYNGGSFFIDFLSRTKLLMHWKCFGSILKQVFYSLFSSISTQSAVLAMPKVVQAL